MLIVIRLVFHLTVPRRVLSVLPPEVTKVKTVGNFPDLTRSPIGEIDNGAPRRKKRAKGWDGEAIDLPPSMTPLTTMDGTTIHYCGGHVG